MPRKARKRRHYLSHAQVAALAHESRFPELVYFLAYTGLRWGEATALRVLHVDLNRQRVFVEENAVRVSGQLVVGTPKTHVTRTVPIPPFLMPYFDAMVSLRAPEIECSAQNVDTDPRGASGGHCVIARRTRGSTGSTRLIPHR